VLHRFADVVQVFAASLGGPGLFLLAFLDSSFLTFPEVPDLLLVWLVIQRPALWPYYSAMATFGSMLGCFAIYFVSRKGGEAMLRRRFKETTANRALATIRRYGLLAVVIPSILPPPAPFKIFVILAGVSGIPVRSFGLAILIGRGFRYTAEALLAYFYGEQAMRYIHDNLGHLSLWTAVAITVVAAVVIVWRRRRSV
jgi:membrane protein YqaA with SNARE-associated domain